MREIFFNDITAVGKTFKAIRWVVYVNIAVIILDALAQRPDLLDPKTAAIVSSLYPLAIMIQGLVSETTPTWTVPPTTSTTTTITTDTPPTSITSSKGAK